MAEAHITPTNIAPTADGTALQIDWQDGHVSVYAPRRLRVLCPCAGCVDEMTGRRILNPDSVPMDIYPTRIDYVGRYALQFHWSDGHDTGFYTFEMLRAVCDCSLCSEAGEA